MDNIPIICVVCGNEFSEMEYPTHMQKAHPSGQAGSIAAQRNIPKQAPVDLPPGVSPADLPDPDFLATIAEMEKEAARPQKPVLPQPMKPQGVVESSPPSPVAQKKITSIQLTYKYTGQDEVGHDVATLETDVADKHFAIAYCLQCNKQIESREVANLRQKEQIKRMVKYMDDMEKGDPLLKVWVCNDSCMKTFETKKGLLLHKRRVNHE